MSTPIGASRIARLIEELTRLTGERPETAAEVALRERLHRLETPEAKEKRRAELQALVDSLAARVKASGLPLVDHGELLYDENGLPREGELSEIELRFYFPERYTRPDIGDGDEAWHSKSKHPKPSE